MQKYILLLLAIFCPGASAQEWVVITPLPHCPAFELEYQFVNYQYALRYKENPQSKDYKIYPNNLKDINNLSSLTDEITEASKTFCDMSYELNLGDERLVCYEKIPTDPFSKQYSNLLTGILGNLKGTKCDDVIPLIELQNQISHLRSEQLIHFDKSGRFLRMFLNSETDVLVDQFFECGGKKGTKNFIRNMIMMEAKNACIFPEESGLLSFEKTLEIADKLANQYPNMSLLKLNAKKDDLTRTAVLAFVDEIFNSQIASLLGPEYDAKGLLNSLDNIKAIKKEKSKLLLDHISYITPLDAPLEIVDKGLPSIIASNFTDILPDNMSPEQKASFIKKTIIPKVQEKYNACIAPIKKRLKYPSAASSKDRIRQRKALEKEFCDNNKEECKKDECSSVKNLLTNRNDISDMEIIQACVFQSFHVALEPTLDKIIRGQKENLSQYIEMNEKAIKAVTDSSLKTLNQCADEKLRKKANQSRLTEESTYANDLEMLYNIHSDDFMKIITECSRLTEEAQIKDFIAIIIDQVTLVKKTFGTNEELEILGIKVDKGSHKFSEDIIAKALPVCNEAQFFRAKKYPGQVVSSLNCTPLVEMEAGQAIIEVTVKDTLKEYGIDHNDNSIIEDMNSCVKKAKDNFLEKLLNKNHPKAILNSDDADKYLKENHEYYGCIKKTVLDITDLLANDVLDQTFADLGSDIKDIGYLKGLKGPIITRLKTCFKKELNTIATWPKFLEYNNDDGLTTLQNRCIEEVTEYALPKVIINETKAQVAELYDIKLTSPQEFDQIYIGLLDSIQKDMRTNYDLSIKANKEKVLELAYIKYRDSHPYSKDIVNDFVNYFSEKAEPTIIAGVATPILDGVIRLGKPRYNFSNLKENLPPKCIASFYQQNTDKIDQLIKLIEKHEKPDAKPIEDLRAEFIDTVTLGLIRAKKQGRYNQLMQNLKKVCANPDNYKDLSKLVATGIGDDLLLSQLEETIIESFEEIAVKQCKESLSKHNLQLQILSYHQTQICEGKLTSHDQLEKIKKNINLYITDPKSRSMVDLILYRKYDTNKLIKDKMKDKGFIDKIFYKDRTTLDYIFKNFDTVIAGEPKISEQLEVIAVGQLFKDKTTGSFADQFVESQLVFSIGDKAFEKVDAGIDKLLKDVENTSFWQSPKKYATKDLIKAYAKPTFHELWNYEKIKEYIGMENTNIADRKKLVQSVYDNAVITELDSSVTESEKLNRSQILEDEIDAHLKANRIHNNPNFKRKKIVSKDNKKYLNFEEKISYDIEDKVTEKVKKTLGAAARVIFTPRFFTFL